MKGELKFTGGNAAKEELDNLRETSQSAHVFEYKRQKYLEKMRKTKVGIRHLQQEGDVVRIDTRPVSFPVYSELVNRESADRQDLMDFGEATGTAAAISTADNKLILQYRGKANRAYGNIPGASTAGMLDAFMEQEVDENGIRIHGTERLEEINEDFIKKNLYKEERKSYRQIQEM